MRSIFDIQDRLDRRCGKPMPMSESIETLRALSVVADEARQVALAFWIEGVAVAFTKEAVAPDVGEHFCRQSAAFAALAERFPARSTERDIATLTSRILGAWGNS